MREQRRSQLSFWRSGLLVLGLYAMLMQAFFGAVGGGAQAGVLAPDEFIAGVICSSGGGEAPLSHTPHAHACICPALCHGGALFAPPMQGADLVLSRQVAPSRITPQASPRSRVRYGARSARGPPHGMPSVRL